jgi:hypothetical protein
MRPDRADLRVSWNSESLRLAKETYSILDVRRVHLHEDRIQHENVRYSTSNEQRQQTIRIYFCQFRRGFHDRDSCIPPY